jgi:tetratricopeptide (TPR) repeat protein
MTFYVQNRNFSAAVSLVKTLPSLDLDHQFLLARLFFYEGKGDDGDKVIQELLDQNPGNYEILNKVGFFYLYNLIRVKTAIGYLEQSLALNPSQPDIVVLIGRLKRDYLEKIRDVWTESPH